MNPDKSKYILAIDLGTSGPKVALFTTAGEIVDYEFEPNDVILLPNGGAEQRPDDWWGAIKTACLRLTAKRLVPVEDIVAICCTSQWSGTVAVDRAGRPLMNALIWLDSRGHVYVRNITRGLVKIQGYGLPRLLKWLRLTGGIPTRSGKDPVAHILYIRHEHPDVYRQTYKFLEPKDYLNLVLTGQFAASFDSIAIHWVTDNRNIDKIDYNPGLLKISTLDRATLPDLRRAVDVLGPIRPEIAAELGLAENTQVVMGTPDLHSAAIGSGAVRDFEANLYVGTSSWLTCHVPFKKVDIIHNMTSLPSAIPGRYLVMNEQESAGACMNFLRDRVLFPDDDLAQPKPPDAYKMFDKMAEKIPAGSRNVIFTPWLYGERTPVEDHTIRGGFHNLSLETTRAQMIRAVFEGVAYNSRWLLVYMEKYLGRPFESINFIGGGANSNLWCQIQADVLNRRIRQVKDPIQANARGAAFLGSVAMGYLTWDQIPERIQIQATYDPNPGNRKIYDELFKEFKNIYAKNKGIYARLNRKR